MSRSSVLKVVLQLPARAGSIALTLSTKIGAPRIADIAPADPNADGERNDTLEIARITIVKVFDDESDGGTAILTKFSDSLPLLDALGMLTFAQAAVTREYFFDDEDDDEDEDAAGV